MRTVGFCKPHLSGEDLESSVDIFKLDHNIMITERGALQAVNRSPLFLQDQGGARLGSLQAIDDSIVPGGNFLFLLSITESCLNAPKRTDRTMEETAFFTPIDRCLRNLMADSSFFLVFSTKYSTNQFFGQL